MNSRTLTILLLRHGETDANATGVIQGHGPSPLNEVGFGQARKLAQRMRLYEPRPEVLVSSDLPRAMQTAEPVAAALGLPIHSDRAWRERGLGELEGKTIGERETWRVATGESDPPGAESFAAMRERVHGALVGLRDRFPLAKTIAVVTHGGPIRMVLRLFADGILPLDGNSIDPEHVPIINCSIMQLRFGDGRWTLAGMNDDAHLETGSSCDAG